MGIIFDSNEMRKKLVKKFAQAKVETIKNCEHISWKHNRNEFETILNRFYQINRA